MALPKPIEQLVQEVFAKYGTDVVQKAKEDPETCLASLLLAIRHDLPRVGSVLKFTVEMAAFRKNLEEARHHLKETVVRK